MYMLIKENRVNIKKEKVKFPFISICLIFLMVFLMSACDSTKPLEPTVTGNTTVSSTPVVASNFVITPLPINTLAPTLAVTKPIPTMSINPTTSLNPTNQSISKTNTNSTSIPITLKNDDSLPLGDKIKKSEFVSNNKTIKLGETYSEVVATWGESKEVNDSLNIYDGMKAGFNNHSFDGARLHISPKNKDNIVESIEVTDTKYEFITFGGIKVGDDAEKILRLVGKPEISKKGNYSEYVFKTTDGMTFSNLNFVVSDNNKIKSIKAMAGFMEE